ncbi:MAG: hypothetical protein Kow009_10500 [Spirochaetales bacterium]
MRTYGKKGQAARMFSGFSLGLLLILSISVASCGRKEEPVLSPVTINEASGERFWKRITEESDYRQYSYWPGHEGVQPGQAPHGVFHKVYINRTLREALPVASRVAPEGSLIVKENLNADRELNAITLMAKVKGFDPEHGDWYWAKYSPEGKVQAEGKVAGCIACHEGMRSNDYIIIKPLDRTLPAR